MWSRTGSDSRCEVRSRAHAGRSSRRPVWPCRRRFNKSSRRPPAGMLRLVPRRLCDRATHGSVRRCYCILSKTSFAAPRGRLPVSGFRDVSCGNIGPWPDHCGSRPKDGQALRVSFVAEYVFHGFIAAAPLKIRSGPLRRRPEWGGMLEPALSTRILGLFYKAVSREVFVFSVVNRLLVRRLLRPALIAEQFCHVHLPSNLSEQADHFLRSQLPPSYPHVCSNVLRQRPILGRDFVREIVP